MKARMLIASAAIMGMFLIVAFVWLLGLANGDRTWAASPREIRECADRCSRDYDTEVYRVYGTGVGTRCVCFVGTPTWESGDA